MRLATTDLFKHVRTDACHTLSCDELKCLQNVLSGMLKELTRFCEMNGIRYVIAGGTLLGAKRHGGFIPWDDDIDLCMPREDFLRFTALLREQYGKKYLVQTPQDTAGYPLLFGRVRMRNTRTGTRDDFFDPDNAGVYIDVFLVENTPDSALFRMLHGAGCMAFGMALSLRKFRRDRDALLKLCEGDRTLEKAIRIKAAAGFVISFASVDRWRKWADGWNGLCRNGDSVYVAVPAGRKRYFGELYRRNGFFGTERILFDGTEMACPTDTDGYLAALYGDYMTPPAECDREKHVFLNPFIPEAPVETGEMHPEEVCRE